MFFAGRLRGFEWEIGFECQRFDCALEWIGAGLILESGALTVSARNRQPLSSSAKTGLFGERSQPIRGFCSWQKPLRGTRKGLRRRPSAGEQNSGD
jgi:hypothetical protein